MIWIASPKLATTPRIAAASKANGSAMVPTVGALGEKKGENNRKNGNRYLAWAFIEAANFAVRYNDKIKSFYQKKKSKTNGVIAIKAVAHKLARACYHIIKDQVPFDVNKAFA